MRKFGIYFGMICLLFAGLSLSAGCGSTSEERLASARAYNQSAQAALDRANAAIAQLQGQLATMPAGEPREQVEAVLAKAQTARQPIAELVSRLTAALAAAKDDADLVNACGQAAAAAVPAPWQPWAFFAASLLGLTTAIYKAVKSGGQKNEAEAQAGAARTDAAQATATAEAIIAAIEAVKKDGLVNFADPDTAARLSTVMGEDGKALVDDVQARAA